MTPPLISSFPMPSRLTLGWTADTKRRLRPAILWLLQPLVYRSIFSDFDEVLRLPPSQRDPETARYCANLCAEWYQMLSSYLGKNPAPTRRRLPFFERLLWDRIERKYLEEIEWYVECFADIIHPDDETGKKVQAIHGMMNSIGS